MREMCPFSLEWFPSSQSRLREGNANGGDGGDGGNGRRSSSLHNSFGRQPEILETYIYAASRPRGAAETGWRGDRVVRVVA